MSGDHARWRFDQGGFDFDDDGHGGDMHVHGGSGFVDGITYVSAHFYSPTVAATSGLIAHEETHHRGWLDEDPYPLQVQNMCD
jgi:hypothetical protein